MKKRTTFIGAMLTLMTIWQQLLIKNSVGLSTQFLIISLSENLYASDAFFYFNRAIKKEDDGDYYGAISDYDKVIEINPNNASAFYNRGIIKGRDLKDYSGSLSDLNQAIEITPIYDQMYVSRCLVKSNLIDYYGAISDCNKAVEINPKDSQAFINRAVTKFLIGDKKGACFDARKGKSLGSSKGSRAVELICK